MNPSKQPQPGHDTHVAINGYALREMRKLAGITTADFIREVSMERSYLSRIENGQRTRVNPRLFANMVSALGVDRRALLAYPHVTQQADAA